MTSKSSYLTRDQASEIIKRASSSNSVLVGGQSVLMWCEHFGIEQPIAVLTRDIDFYGGKEAVLEAADSLGAYNPRVYMATLDDVTPNSGKIAIDIPGLATPCEIDFVYLVKGLGSMEVLDKAVEMWIDGVQLNVIHPLLLIESKLTNVATIPHKRGEEGVAQARLSIEIARHYIEMRMAEDEPRTTLNMVKRALRFATTDEARYCWYHHGLDVTRAVPLDKLKASKEPTLQRFVAEGFPVELRRLEEQRARYKQIVDKQKVFEAQKRAAEQPSAAADDGPSF
jgi:hypothetical protein